MKFDLMQWEISGLLKNASLLDVPPFQRESEVWTPKKKKLLIDTILKGWKIPKIYLNNPQDQVYEIVDGQQRIFAILDFIQNGFKITLPNSDKEFYFKSLETKYQEAILNYKLDIEVIREADEDEVADLFSRLQEGVALRPSEKINALTGNLSDFVNEIEKSDFFNKTDFRKKRYGTKGVCQQICFLEANGLGSAKYPSLREFFENNRDFDDEATKKKIQSTLSYMNDIFPDAEDYLSKSGNVISIYSICSWIMNLQNSISTQKLHNFFNNFFRDFEQKSREDRDFIEYNLSLIQSTSGAQSIITRYTVLRKHLILSEPLLIKNLTNEEKVHFHSSMESSFDEKVEQIHNLMKEINERAIGSGKHVIFDLTTESSYALTLLSHRIRNENDYKKLIELTWKAFYEGSGSANKIGNLSDDRNHVKPMTEVNILIKIDDLRKVEAHDLEHDRSTYEEKIKTACEIRDLFTGKKHITDFDENDYTIFQYKLINELLDFMKTFNASIN